MEETFGQRILRLRKRAGLTQKALADRVGVSASQISALEADERTEGPQARKIVPLARALGVSTDYLLTGESLAMLASPAQPTTGASSSSFGMVWQPPQRPRGVVPTAWTVQVVPLVQQDIHAGGERSDDPDSLPVAVPRNGRYLCMRVAGQCMLPDIEPGDIVVLDQEMAPKPDWVVALRVAGETRLTRMIRRDPAEWQFMPDNPEFQGLTVPADSVEVIGVVIARQKGPGVRRSPRSLALLR